MSHLWVTTSAVQPTFWDSDSFNFKCHGRKLAPNRCSLGGGSAWDVVLQPSPGDFCVLPKTVILDKTSDSTESLSQVLKSSSFSCFISVCPFVALLKAIYVENVHSCFVLFKLKSVHIFNLLLRVLICFPERYRHGGLVVKASAS